ncbi:MAG TPA: DUF1499 domain-containing protein [Gemmatimonadota bacterium]|jgi:uncharacterized protein (DUF1499 family)
MTLTRPTLAALALAGAAVLVTLAAPAGAAVGLWDFRGGFTVLRVGVYASLAALAVALAALVAALAAGRTRSAGVAGAAALVAALAALPPVSQYLLARSVPPINDITTDPADPPAFTRAGAEEENGGAGAPYPGEEFAAQQRVAYPDVGTIRVAAPPEETFRAARAVADGMGWDVVLEDAAAGRLEAVATTRWFRFEDDVAVRVRREDGGTEVDVRSRSRVGVSDVGANAARIREFREALLDELGS